MKTYCFNILLAVLSALTFQGCRSDEPFKHVVFADSPEMFNLITYEGKGSRGAGEIAEDVSYYIVFDDVKRNATLTINNLRTDNGERGIIATFSDVTWTYEPGSHEKRRIIECAELHSDPNPGADITLTDVTIIYNETNELDPEPSAGFYASFVVNGTLKFTAFPYEVYADGTTVIAARASEAERDIDYDATYHLTFDPQSKEATLSVDNFDVDGVECEFEISRLSLILSDKGYELKSSGVSVVNSSDAALKVESVSANAELRGNLIVEMELSVGGKAYGVEATLSPNRSVLK